MSGATIAVHAAVAANAARAKIGAGLIAVLVQR